MIMETQEKILTIEDFKNFGRKGGLKSWYSKTEEEKRQRVEELAIARKQAAEERRKQKCEQPLDSNL